jgi:uncharacterized protein (TIGR03437 family)
MRTLLALLAWFPLAAAPRFEVTLLAGSGWVGDGGLARDSLLLQAEGLAADREGNLYVADAQTHRVRRISPAGIIETVAGTGVAGFSGDGGPAREARLHSPYGLAVDAAGNLYIADLGNHRVRRMARDGTITTLSDGFETPRNLALDAAGRVHVSDFTRHCIYRLSAAGLEAVASAPLRFPAGLAIAADGALYVGDTGNHVVRKLAGGIWSTVAEALAPTGLAIDSTGKLHIADVGTNGARDVAVGPGNVVYTTDGRLVRRSSSSAIVVIAGRGDPARGDLGPATEARLNNPSGLALDAQGNLYIADRDNHRIRRVDTRGIITTFAGVGVAGADGDDGPAVLAELNRPTTLSFDAAGNLYILDTGNGRIRRVTPSGIIARASSMPEPAATDAEGNRYFLDAALRLARVNATGAVELLETSTPILLPTCVLPAPDGSLLVADADQDRVWRLTPAPPPPAPVTLLRLPSMLAPGMIVAVEGLALAQPEIFINNRRALVLASTSAQTLALAPAELQPGAAEIEIRDRGATLARLERPVAAAAPLLYALVNEYGGLNAAARGSIASLYGTGQGVEPLPVLVFVGPFAAEVLYSGAVAGYPGLWQLNFRLPGGFLAPGEYPLTVAVGGAVSASLPIRLD